MGFFFKVVSLLIRFSLWAKSCTFKSLYCEEKASLLAVARPFYWLLTVVWVCLRGFMLWKDCLFGEIDWWPKFFCFPPFKFSNTTLWPREAWPFDVLLSLLCDISFTRYTNVLVLFCMPSNFSTFPSLLILLCCYCCRANLRICSSLSLSALIVSCFFCDIWQDPSALVTAADTPTSLMDYLEMVCGGWEAVWTTFICLTVMQGVGMVVVLC